MSRIYTDKEKVAYYKSLALTGRVPPAPGPMPRRRYVRATPAAAPARRASTTRRVVSSPSKMYPKVEGRGEYTRKKEKSVGHRIGSKIGGFLGHGIQQVIKNITGFGDYQVESNVLLNGGVTPPQIINSDYNDGKIIVRHREYIGDVSATTNFTNVAYSINPGLFATFPWLANLARCYEEYEMRGLIFEFKSTSSDAVLSSSASTSLGSVIMCTQYDVTEPDFTDKATMLNHEFANSAKPSECFYHPVECKRSITPISQLFVRSGAVTTNNDPRLYDLGRFQIATVGMQNAGVGDVIGELWATYEISFSKSAKLETAPIGEILTAHYQLATWGNTAPIGTASTLSGSSSLRGTITGSGALYNFPSSVVNGKYLFVFYWRGSTGATIAYPALTLANCTQLVLWQSNGSNAAAAPPAGTTSVVSAMMAFIIDVTGPNAVVGVGACTLPGGANLSSDLYITQIDEDLINEMPIDNRIKELTSKLDEDDDEYVKVSKKKLEMLCSK